MNSRFESDSKAWLEIWSSWPDREVFAHPAYVSLFAGPEGEPLCVSWRGPEGGVLFPLVLRNIGLEEWAGGEVQHRDLVSPYGYGGPFTWGEVDVESFWDEFDRWAREISAVTCFARLSLFPHQSLPFRGTVVNERPNIVRSLCDDPDKMWMDYEHKVRKNVKKACRAGLRVEIDSQGTRLDEFLDIYFQTLERREASADYFFSQDFFQSIVRELHGSFVFFHVISGNEVVASELVLVSSQVAYSFLGGTRFEAFALRPNDLLKHTAFSWAREQGKKSFVLGGGYESEDGIFRYKRSFSPRGTVRFCVGIRILDENAYRDLVDKRKTYEQRRGEVWEPKLGFFPAYRG